MDLWKIDSEFYLQPVRVENKNKSLFVEQTGRFLIVQHQMEWGESLEIDSSEEFF